MNATTSVTRQTLLVIAARLLELVGYNGFSFRDLALRAKITTASVHYHFPTKGDLGLALVNQQAGKMDGEKMGDGKMGDGKMAK